MRLIDADVIIKNLTGMKNYYDAIALDGMIKALKEAPAIEAQTAVHGEWIPVTKELPKTSEEVLVTLGYTYESDYTMYSIARYLRFDDGEHHWCDNRYGYLEWDKYSDGRGGNSSYKVIAWMSLPKLYKADI